MKGMDSGNRMRGFTMVEMMFVVAVLGILTTFAVPQYLNARKAANEGAAIGSLRLICCAQIMYQERHGSYGTLDQLVTRGLIDPRLATRLVGVTNSQLSGSAPTSSRSPLTRKHLETPATATSSWTIQESSEDPPSARPIPRTPPWTRNND